jgi:hypothetical protein
MKMMIVAAAISVAMMISSSLSRMRVMPLPPCSCRGADALRASAPFRSSARRHFAPVASRHYCGFPRERKPGGTDRRS